MNFQKSVSGELQSAQVVHGSFESHYRHQFRVCPGLDKVRQLSPYALLRYPTSQAWAAVPQKLELFYRL